MCSAQQRSIASWPRWTNRPPSAAGITRSFCWRARYGLRPCDIRQLTLDDIDWRAGRIDLRQLKTGRPLALPLLPDVAQALSAYVRDGRPASSDRTIFLRHCAPFEPFAAREQPDCEHARSPSARWPRRTNWSAGHVPVPPHTCHTAAGWRAPTQDNRRCPGPCFHRHHIRVYPRRSRWTPHGGHLRRGGEPMSAPSEASDSDSSRR